MASVPEPSYPAWMETLARVLRTRPAVVFAAAAVFAAGALFLGVAYKSEVASEVAGLALFAVVLAGTGIWYVSRDPTGMDELDATRIFVLIVGGGLGFLISVFTFIRIYRWLEFFTGGIETWQGANAWRIWVCVVAELVGLIILFATLQLARTEERKNAVLRRLLYGYNAVLSLLLLSAVLVVMNILVYVYLPAVSDWTASSLYTLSPRSKNLLEGLDKPVRVYVFLSSRDDQVFGDVKNLMDNCEAVTNKIQVEYLSRDRNPERIAELVRHYQLIDIEGLLVVYGTDPNERHQFVKSEELGDFGGRRGPDDKPRFVFKGEDALMTAIDALEVGKKPVVYFTQGNGELDLTDTAPRAVDQGSGVLRDRLKKANYDVKGLRFSPVGGGANLGPDMVTSKEVPDDAVIVVIAGPREPFAPEAIAALRKYMKPADPKKAPGKMVVLMDVVVARGGNQMVQTGLEPFLGEFNVEVGNNRIMTPSSRPLQIRVTPNPRLRQTNPVAAAFDRLAFPMYNVRTVRPRAGGAAPEGGSNYHADTLLMTYDMAWAETDLATEPSQLIKDLIQNRRQELEAKISREPLSVAVAVSESAADEAFNPHRPRQQAPDQKPRMIVMGDASFASNPSMEEGNPIGYDLFASCLAWLQERPSSIGIEHKKRDIYQLEPNTNVSRMTWMPFALMSLGVLGLGLGVWVVRRT